MSDPRILERLEIRTYQITPAEILGCKLSSLREQGLQVLAICNNGTGRSRVVAEDLSRNHGIPAAYMLGGLTALCENPEMVSQRGMLFYLLNEVPLLAVILTKQERVMYLQLLNQLKAYWYPESSKAIESIRNMQST
jgi:hypothetical protein